jgi:hypothetical protein
MNISILGHQNYSIFFIKNDVVNTTYSMSIFSLKWWWYESVLSPYLFIIDYAKWFGNNLKN